MDINRYKAQHDRSIAKRSARQAAENEKQRVRNERWAQRCDRQLERRLKVLMRRTVRVLVKRYRKGDSAVLTGLFQPDGLYYEHSVPGALNYRYPLYHVREYGIEEAFEVYKNATPDDWKIDFKLCMRAWDPGYVRSVSFTLRPKGM